MIYLGQFVVPPFERVLISQSDTEIICLIYDTVGGPVNPTLPYFAFFITIWFWKKSFLLDRYVVQCIISSHQGFKVYYYTIHFAKPFNSINCFCHLLNWKLECQASLFKNGVQSNEQFPIRMFDVSCKLYKYLPMLE